MGRVNPQLHIVVWEGWLRHPEVQQLIETGHNITPYGQVTDEPDLILHPAAHGWHEELFGGPYLKTALMAARKRRRERKAK